MNTWRSQPADSLLEEAYARFIYRFELETLRRVYFTGAALNVAFVVVDYLRNTDFFWVAVFRTIMISLVLATALWTYIGAITSARLRIVTLTSSSLYLILGFFLDFRGNMPDFFMPNFILLMVYGFLVFRGFQISMLLKRYQERALALSLSLLVVLAVFINAGVTLGLLPTKGLTLPLLSYGGSSLICTGLCIGWLLNLGRESTIPLSFRDKEIE